MCIDDYAVRPGVDEAVLWLAQHGRVSATSCMVASPRWPAAAAPLRALPPGMLDIGLHLAFTEEPLDGSNRTGLGPLIARAYLGQLSPTRIAAEVRAQFDAFEDGLGRAPDHVDGHHHIHQLPVVRDALLDELVRRGCTRTWLRGTRAPARRTGPEAAPDRRPGRRSLRAGATRLGLPMSGHLLGVYGFDADRQRYARLLAAWLQRATDGDVLMCHPARNGPDGAGDRFAAARAVEAEVLGQRRLAAPAGAGRGHRGALRAPA